MPDELEDGFRVLERKVLEFSEAYQNLALKHRELSEDLLKMRLKYEDEHRKNRILEEEKKEIKLSLAVSHGGSLHSRLIKRHINRLVREIDVCVSELRNIGL